MANLAAAMVDRSALRPAIQMFKANGRKVRFAHVRGRCSEGLAFPKRPLATSAAGGRAEPIDRLLQRGRCPLLRGLSKVQKCRSNFSQGSVALISRRS